MGEDVRSSETAMKLTESYIEIIDEIDRKGTDISVSVKPTALGATFDRDLALDNLMRICETASAHGIGFEIDMEGTRLVDHILEGAVLCAEAGHPVMLALQAYLHRTVEDIELALDMGVEVRLVKGAYMGDIADFSKVQDRFRTLVRRLVETGDPFCVGTHDPEMIDWAKGLDIRRERIEFGFLMGLADETKIELVRDGWQVSEYVPFGGDTRAYRLRRERYLKILDELGREPAP
jgi:proline dehydrogenase